MKMKRKIILLCLLLMHLLSFSQMKKWVLGTSQWRADGASVNTAAAGLLQFFEVDFLGVSPLFSERKLGNSVKNIVSAGINEGMISATDKAGNIAFYAFPNVIRPYASTADTIYLVAYSVLTGEDEVFAKIPPASVCGNSIKETEIVRREGTSNQYYFIYKTACINNIADDSWRYVIVDVSAKTISAPYTLLSQSLNEGMAVSTYNCTLNNHWLFFVKYDNGNLLLYRSSITATNISPPTLVSTLVIQGNYSLGQGDIEISPTSDKIAIANYTSSDIKEDIAILDLDIKTGNVSNLRWIDNPKNYMIVLEFSPNGRQLYAFSGGSSAVTAEMFNIPVPATGDYIIQSTDLLNIPIPVGHSIEIGYDGKLYFTVDKYNSKLFYISNPNTIAAANIISTTADNSFGFNNVISYALPDQIDGETSTEKPITILQNDTTLCKGQSITLKASEGTIFKWFPGNATTPTITVSPLVTTTYYLTVSNNCGQYEDSVTIRIGGDPIQLSMRDTSICKGQSIKFSVSGGISYQWSGGISSTASSIEVTPLVSTSYYLNVSNSCTSVKDTVTVMVRDLPIALITGNMIICEGQSTILTASGGTSYQWSGGSNATTPSITVKPLVTTQYELVIFDGMCYGSPSTISVIVNSNPEIAISGKETICAGSIAIYNVIIKSGVSPYQFIWTNGSTSASVSFSSLSSKPLGVLVVDNNGCHDSTTININVLPKPTALFTGKISGCTPVKALFSNQSLNATLYRWNFGDGNSSDLRNPIHTYENSGTYNVTLIAHNDICADTMIFKNYITVYPSPKASITYSTNNTKDFEIFNHSSSTDECILYYGDGDSLKGCSWQVVSHNYKLDGEYSIIQIVSNTNGCRDTSTIKIISETEGILFYPNSFTPDEDGLNDIFYAYGLNVKSFYMSIYNRWGQLIFQSDNLGNGWDGYYRGSLVEQGVYAFKIDYELKKGNSKTLYGHVNVIR